jgi:hypothetical protein
VGGVQRSKTVLAAILLMWVGAACLYKPGNRVITQCMLPETQRGTVLYQWPVTPIPVSIDSKSGFTDYEKSLVISATRWRKAMTGCCWRCSAATS